jgi:hypothetical protein
VTFTISPVTPTDIAAVAPAPPARALAPELVRAGSMFTGQLGGGGMAATGVISLRITGAALARPLRFAAPLDAAGKFSLAFPTATLRGALARAKAPTRAGAAARLFKVEFSYAGDGNFQPLRASESFVVIYSPQVRMPRGKTVRAGKPLVLRLRINDNLGSNVSAAALEARVVALVGPRDQHFGPSRVARINPRGLFTIDVRRGEYFFTLDTTRLQKGSFLLGYRIGTNQNLYTLRFAVV